MANDLLNPNAPVPALPRKNPNAVPSKPAQLTPPLLGLATVSEPGVYGGSGFNGRPGVWGSHNGTGHGVFGDSASGVGVFGRGAYLAGYFEGDVGINGTLEVVGRINVFGPDCDICLQNADCAEDFDIYGTLKVEPGTVMVLGDDGTLLECEAGYDKRVAGVISGAGEYRPAIVLDGRKPGNRQPIALIGKVYCKVDAGHGAIQIGDLLTTSPTRGHAMIAAEPHRAFGTIIGKALGPLASGQGMIPILVALQ
jgi:hypothetical protein